MKIKLGGKEFDLEFKENYFQASGNWGWNNQNEAKIIVDASIPKDQRKETLIHELIETINFNFELKLEHKVISTISNALTEYILSNNFLKFNDDILEPKTKYLAI